MMKKTDTNKLLFATTYLALLGTSGLLGAWIVFTMTIPAILNLGSYYAGNAMMVGGLGVFSLLLTGVTAVATAMLWQGKEAGQVMTIVLALLLAAISALSLPFMFILGLEGIALMVPLFTAVVVLLASGAIWYLLRHEPTSLR